MKSPAQKRISGNHICTVPSLNLCLYLSYCLCFIFLISLEIGENFIQASTGTKSGIWKSFSTMPKLSRGMPLKSSREVFAASFEYHFNGQFNSLPEILISCVTLCCSLWLVLIHFTVSPHSWSNNKYISTYYTFCSCDLHRVGTCRLSWIFQIKFVHRPELFFFFHMEFLDSAPTNWLHP